MLLAWERVLGVDFPARPWLDDTDVEAWLETAGGGDLTRLRARLEYLLPLREESGMDLSRNLLASLDEVRRRDRSRDREQEPEKPAPGEPEER